jgi:hypothetical protein
LATAAWYAPFRAAKSAAFRHRQVVGSPPFSTQGVTRPAIRSMPALSAFASSISAAAVSSSGGFFSASAAAGNASTRIATTARFIFSNFPRSAGGRRETTPAS